MNILRSIGIVAVTGLVALGGIEIVERAVLPGFQGVVATAYGVPLWAGGGAIARARAER